MPLAPMPSIDRPASSHRSNCEQNDVREAYGFAIERMGKGGKGGLQDGAWR